MSLNLNCSGRLEEDGPHPPSGLSIIGGRENEAIFEMRIAFEVYQPLQFSPAIGECMARGQLALCDHEVGAVTCLSQGLC